MSKLGRLTFPTALFAYPFYLWQRSPGKKGSHYDPMCDLFAPNERKLVSHCDNNPLYPDKRANSSRKTSNKAYCSVCIAEGRARSRVHGI